jgi:hypothetical protein
MPILGLRLFNPSQKYREVRNIGVRPEKLAQKDQILKS